MDPNANLQEQLSIAKIILDDRESHIYGSVRLAELVEALDKWIKRGGFLPERWERERKTKP